MIKIVNMINNNEISTWYVKIVWIEEIEMNIAMITAKEMISNMMNKIMEADKDEDLIMLRLQAGSITKKD